MFKSPLRYPGGKNKLAAFLAKICVEHDINGRYVEPYAGGASVALFLLLEGFVGKITINDKDSSIYAFWYCVLNRTDELIELIKSTDITVENWYIQKEVQGRKENADILELGFSTLFLNRTNRSGIISAGMIGGVEQKGDYKIDCRFNKEDIIQRIVNIAKRKEDIDLFNEDAITLLDNVERFYDSNNTILYFDPPYYLKAESLYMNHYGLDDHKEVSDRIKTIDNFKWIVSYDNVEEIRDLYSEYPKKEYSFNHSAFSSREGKEILFFSDDSLTAELELDEKNPVFFRYKKKRKNGSKEFFYKETRRKKKVV